MSAPNPEVGLFKGRHVLGEFYGVDPGLLDDEPRLCTVLQQALAEAKATVVAMASHHFDPQGVTVMALLSESHATMHSYPDYHPGEGGACYVDVFTCGSVADPERAFHALSTALRPARYHVVILDRGTPAPPIPHPLTSLRKANP
ncbi:adenosylmethionine decarboxylase [Nonomuraea sp. SYSU D8015]|uniref:adenosylmethionine decarboxylase n=1 Tax=Nonomuraea sp. SYSU D8015 TaxID=2593644 RepID=UPI0016603621|nr:adenosylmethionine decarboxylase [Nonomuraea sp. SYSU D8015]